VLVLVPPPHPASAAETVVVEAEGTEKKAAWSKHAELFKRCVYPMEQRGVAVFSARRNRSDNNLNSKKKLSFPHDGNMRVVLQCVPCFATRGS
jgi:hypothetical protein